MNSYHSSQVSLVLRHVHKQETSGICTKAICRMNIYRNKTSKICTKARHGRTRWYLKSTSNTKSLFSCLGSFSQRPARSTEGHVKETRCSMQYTGMNDLSLHLTTVVLAKISRFVSRMSRHICLSQDFASHKS